MPHMPYALHIKDSGKLLGTLTDDQLAELVDLLEEEDSDDHDYYIDKDVLAFMEEEGASEELLALLRPHVSDEDGIEIEWKETAA
jgi:hypothetical protein